MLVSVSASLASTFYVRPGQHATYGTGDGTSYNNAWNGITNIVWRGTGVLPGDTIYVCGTNIFTLGGANQYFNKGIANLGTNGVTIRGDYGPDPLVHFAGSLIGAYLPIYWQGPDAHSVYYTTNAFIDGNYREMRFQVDSGSIQWLPVKGSVTWTDGAGAAFIGGTNFVHTISGNAPSNNIALRNGGWVWNLNSQCSNTFNGGTYISSAFEESGNGWWIGTTNTSWINLTLQRFQFLISNGQDHWTFGNCDISGGDFGIYDQQVLGAKQGTFQTIVTNCTIHDIRNYYGIPDQDLHGIGIQAGCGWTVTGNQIYNTDGTAIDLFSAGLYMTNNLISRNFIHDISGLINSGDGIAFDNGTTVPVGTMTGNVVERNIIYNVNINGAYSWVGIGANCRDRILVLNNTIVFCGTGIFIDSGATANPAIVLNNIIYRPTNTFIVLNGTGTQTGISDYNLCFSNSLLGTPFTFTPSTVHDTHSVFVNPKLFSLNRSSPDNFQVIGGSPAINAATNSASGLDFDGASVSVNSTIGAWQRFRFKPPTITNITVQQMLN